MKASFILLAAADLVLMAVTAAAGTTVAGTTNFVRHFLLGVMTGLFTCFVHVVTFTFFVVQDKIVKQAVRSHGLSGSWAQEADRLKSRALRSGVAGMLAVLVAVAFGAAVGIAATPRAHLIAAMTAIAINVAVFTRQYALILRLGRLVGRAFGEV